MDRITLTDFNATHGGEEISPQLFERLSQRAADLTEELTFGRTEGKEEHLRRAMKEMIAYWITLDGGTEGRAKIVREDVGNYSATWAQEPVLTVRGVPLSPAALLILQKAGLRDGHG